MKRKREPTGRGNAGDPVPAHQELAALQSEGFNCSVVALALVAISVATFTAWFGELALLNLVGRFIVVMTAVVAIAAFSIALVPSVLTTLNITKGGLSVTWEPEKVRERVRDVQQSMKYSAGVAFTVFILFLATTLLTHQPIPIK